ncbi:MAG: peptidylprolyl isomerase [Planctomycetota bacterium]
MPETRFCPRARAAAVTALGKGYLGTEPEDLMVHDPSGMVRRAAFQAYIQRPPKDAVARVREWGRSRDALQRRAAAQAARTLGGEEARGILMGLAGDREVLVAIEAIDQLQHFPGEETRAALRTYCGSEDNGLALAAVDSLSAGELDAGDYPSLAAAFYRAEGDGAAELCAAVVKSIARIQGSDAEEFLRQAGLHPEPYVADLARRSLAERGIEWQDSEEPAQARPAPDPAPVRAPDLPNPRIAIETNRGTMVFELYPDVAPGHVHNILVLAGQGYYDRLTWHRVVSDFVIQGGCYRGDGNGGGTWRGSDDSLGQEFNELRYEEGSLGMPRNANPDSGGSQIFITNRPTPHLDGQYTLFGGLVSGKEPLHTLEEGDRILTIRPIP